MVYFGWDVELTTSVRNAFAYCEIGAHLLIPTSRALPRGGSKRQKTVEYAEPSPHDADHFNERCLSKDAEWSIHTTKVHGITKAQLV